MKTNRLFVAGIILSATALAGSTASAQEYALRFSHAYVDPFYTDEIAADDATVAFNGSEQRTHELSTEAAEKDASEVREVTQPTAGTETAVQEALNDARMIATAFDESLVPPASIRQLSCRPY